MTFPKEIWFLILEWFFDFDTYASLEKNIEMAKKMRTTCRFFNYKICEMLEKAILARLPEYEKNRAEKKGIYFFMSSRDLFFEKLAAPGIWCLKPRVRDISREILIDGLKKRNLILLGFTRGREQDERYIKNCRMIKHLEN